MKTREIIGIICFGIAGISFYSCKPEEIILHGDISGIVTDAETNQPLQAATVKLNPVNETVSTGSDGRFMFKSLTPGDYEIEASKQNYAEGKNSATVTSASTTDIDFELDAIPVLHYSTPLLNFGFYISSLTFTISKTGTGSVAYMVTPSKDWISVEPGTGDIDNETDNITVTLKRTDLTQTSYNEWIMITSTYKEFFFRDTIDIYVGVHKIIFNPDLTYGTVADIEGNVYKTIIIGTQVWMAENLKTTEYNDNKPIPEVTDNTVWRNLQTPGYCWLNNDSATYRAVRGALYNGYTVNAGKLCPTGWHIPSKDEWNTMVTFIGGNSGGGKKLKETGTTHWVAYTEAVNQYGFTALPSGWRNTSGLFTRIGDDADWWTSTEFDTSDIWAFSISADAGINDIFPWHDNKVLGHSIRCIKD
jgi:uncharacterized protein (TIGR02145 family)